MKKHKNFSQIQKEKNIPKNQNIHTLNSISNSPITNDKSTQNIKNQNQSLNNSKDNNELTKFFQILKETLVKGIKEKEDKSKYNIEIRTTEEYPNNSSINFFTLNDLKFNKYFDGYQKYYQKAMIIFSLRFEAKRNNSIQNIKKFYEKLKTDLMKNQDFSLNFELLFRNEGKDIFFDLILVKNEIIKHLLALGIDLNDYEKFDLCINSSFNINDLLSDDIDIKNFLNNIFSLIISIKSSRGNIKYLIEALKETLQYTNFLNTPDIRKLIDYTENFFNFSKVLSKLNIELNSKILIDEIFKFIIKNTENKNTEQTENKTTKIDKLNNNFNNFKKSLKEEGSEEIKKKLEKNEYLSFSKSVNLDNVSFYLGIPKYKNGLALILNFSGLTKFVRISLK